jgi:hypothetical protein
MTTYEQSAWDKLRTDIAKLTTETVRIGLESRWSPVMFTGSIIAATTVAVFALAGCIFALPKMLDG